MNVLTNQGCTLSNLWSSTEVWEPSLFVIPLQVRQAESFHPSVDSCVQVSSISFTPRHFMCLLQFWILQRTLADIDTDALQNAL